MKVIDEFVDGCLLFLEKIGDAIVDLFKSIKEYFCGEKVMKNIMEEIAAMLNIQMDKPFDVFYEDEKGRIISLNGNPFTFTKNGVKRRTGEINHHVLGHLLTGTCHIKQILEPFLSDDDKSFLTSFINKENVIIIDIKKHHYQLEIHAYDYLGNEVTHFKYFACSNTEASNKTGAATVPIGYFKNLRENESYSLKELGM